MAITDMATFWYPNHQMDSHPNPANLTLDASGEYAAHVMMSPFTGNIHKIHCQVATVTANGDLLLQIETVDATTGLPTGTLWATNTTGTLAVSATGWQNVTLTADAAVTAGDVFAVVLRWSSGNYAVRSIRGFAVSSFPYGVVNGSKNNADRALAPIELDDATFPRLIGHNMGAYSNVSVTNSAHERGGKIVLPFEGRCIGVNLYYGNPGTNYVLRLYDSANTLLWESPSLDKDIYHADNKGAFFPLDAPLTLPADDYYLVINGTNSATFYYLAALSAAHAASFHEYPAAVMVNRAASTDAWTETADTFVQASLLFDGIDLGSGGSGIAVLSGGGLAR